MPLLTIFQLYHSYISPIHVRLVFHQYKARVTIKLRDFQVSNPNPQPQRDPVLPYHTVNTISYFLILTQAPNMHVVVFITFNPLPHNATF